jgi:hypothetical protein
MSCNTMMAVISEFILMQFHEGYVINSFAYVCVLGLK